MIRPLTGLLLSLFLYAKMLAQGSFAIANIPVELNQAANAVVRNHVHQIEIVDVGTAKESFSIVTTVLNPRGKEYKNFQVSYDKFSKVESISGVIYDSKGSVLKKIRKVDFKDISATSNGTLYGDNRMLVYESTLTNYPLTFEFQYTKSYSGLLFVSPFDPVPNYNVAVQSAEYDIKSPRSIDFRVATLNFDFKFVDQSTSAQLHHNWSLKNFLAVKAEAYSPPAMKIFPYILVGMNKFKVEEYSGSMDSWKNFGLWINLLNQTKDDLDPVAIQAVNMLTEGLEAPEKVKALYNFLQSKTRYVSIQLGIGGWQPFPASFVDKNGYGDCKALVNYMKSLLSAAGINSYYTLVRAGTRAADINIDFPSSQFNHVILCVPQERDTIWLECTSQTQPFGFLGSFTADRHALLIDDAGGHLIKTPRYHAAANVQATATEVEILENGVASLKIMRQSHGLQAENGGLDQIVNFHESDQRRWLNESIGIESIEISSFLIKKNNEIDIPFINTDVDAKARNIYTRSGKRIFFKPNMVNSFRVTLEGSDFRKYPIYLRNEFIDIDTIWISIPLEFKAEFVPPAKEVTSQFGEYSYQIEMDAVKGMLTYTRKLSMNKGAFPAESYADLVSFFREIKKGDEQKVVFVSTD